MAGWKKILFLVAAVIMLLAGGGLAWYFGHYTRTPEYAVSQMEQAFTKQDEKLFAEYVDVDGVLDHSYDDFMSGLVETEHPMNEEAKGAVESFAQMVKAPLMTSFREAIFYYVSTGKWPSGEGEASNLLDSATALEKAGLKGTSFLGVDGFEREVSDNDAVVLVRVHQEEADADFVLRVRLEQKENGRYQATEIENFRDFMELLSKARRTQIDAYLKETANIVAAHEKNVRAAAEEQADILATGALGSEATRTQLKQLMEEKVIPDWQAREAELAGVSVPKAAEPLQRLRIKICELEIGYAQGYADWMTDKNAQTIRVAESKHKQAKTLEEEEKFLTRQIAGE